MNSYTQNPPAGDSSTATPVPVEIRRAAEEKVMSVRRMTEYFYAQSKKAEQRAMAAAKQAGQREMGYLGDMIRVADSFEDVFRAVEQDRKLRKQKEAVEAFRTTYLTLLHALENHGVYAVPVLGKKYNEVEFRGVPVPEPWNVVTVSEDPPHKRGQGVATRVLRTLWVRVIEGQVAVLRPAQVIY
jgi:hypothetical protein